MTRSQLVKTCERIVKSGERRYYQYGQYVAVRLLILTIYHNDTLQIHYNTFPVHQSNNFYLDSVMATSNSEINTLDSLNLVDQALTRIHAI